MDLTGFFLVVWIGVAVYLSQVAVAAQDEPAPRGVKIFAAIVFALGAYGFWAFGFQ